MIMEEFNYGQVVVCDGCNGPHGKNLMGGVLVGSHAMCGECCDRYGYDKPDHEYADEIDEIWSKDKTFHDNVLDYRQRVSGSKDMIVRIGSF
jgi:hypothetical protein